MTIQAQPEALRLATRLQSDYENEKFTMFTCADEAVRVLRSQHARIATLEAELAALKAAPAEKAVEPDVSSAVDALVTAAFIEGGVSAANTEAARQVTEQRKQELQAAIAALVAPQAQDVQDAETLHLARVAVSESEGCSFPQDWMDAAIKVCKSVIAASAKGGV